MIAELSDVDRETVVRHWLGCSAAEARAAQSFIVIRDALEALGADSTLVRLAARAIDDEQRHAEICRIVASRYQGSELELPAPLPLQVPRHRGASPRVLLTLYVVGQCVFNETTATVYLEMCLRHAESATARRALGELCSDDIDHARIGWAYLSSLDRSDRLAVRPWLLQLAKGNIREWRRAGGPRATPKHAEYGVPSREAVESAIRVAMRELTIPGLHRVGLHAPALSAWAETDMPT